MPQQPGKLINPSTPNTMDTNTATFLIALFLIQSASANPRRSFEPPILECIEKENVTKESAYSILYDGNLALAESNPNLKCFTACALETKEVLDGCKLVYFDKLSGGAQYDNTQYNAVEFCKNAVKSNERCECGYEFIKCFKGYYDQIDQERKNN